jgi:hypothetical protein
MDGQCGRESELWWREEQGEGGAEHHEGAATRWAEQHRVPAGL